MSVRVLRGKRLPPTLAPPSPLHVCCLVEPENTFASFRAEVFFVAQRCGDGEVLPFQGSTERHVRSADDRRADRHTRGRGLPARSKVGALLGGRFRGAKHARIGLRKPKEPRILMGKARGGGTRQELRMHGDSTSLQADEPHKACTKCGVEKPLSAYYRKKDNRDGHFNSCKECQREKVRQWHRDNPQWYPAYRKRWEAENPDKLRELRRRARMRQSPEKKAEYIARWRAKNPNRVKRQQRRKVIRRYFDLEPMEYDALVANLLVAQDSRCAICQREFDDERAYRLDHDHATGRARGLLCPSCNLALGQFSDNAAWLRRAADYVERDVNVQVREQPSQP